MNPLKIVKAVPMALLVVAALLSSSTLAMAQAGNLDLTFGTGGIVTTPNTSDARALAIQSDGKIVVAGQATGTAALARYNTDGSLDATFGTGGIVVIPPHFIGGPPLGVAIQQDGKIVTVAPTDLSMVVFRFNTDGTLDQNFGSGGEVSLGFSLGGGPGAIAVQSDGKILVTGSTGLVRLLSNGQFDSSFGTGGVAPLVSGLETLLLLSSGKTLAMGFNGGAAQYNADGSLDLSFGVAGQTPRLGQTSAIALLSNGQFVIVGALTSGPSLGVNPEGFVVVRYNSDGTIDATFGTRGGAITNFPGHSLSVALAVAVQPNGNIVAAGYTAVQNPPQASDFALARYTAEGQLDTTFGTNGLVITSSNGDYASIIALAIQSDGKIVALSRSFSGGLNRGFTLARYLSE